MAFTQPDSFNIGPFEVRKNPSPAELAEKLNRLREAVDQIRIQPGPGYLVNRGRGGTTLQILPKTAVQSVASHPFQVVSSVVSSTQRFFVEPLSYLNGGAVTISGLGTVTTFTSFPSHVVLEATVASNASVTSAAIVQFATSTTVNLCEPADGAGVQTKSRVIVATVTTTGVVQSIRENVQTETGCLNGFAVITLQ